jgi:hypothetical protein
VSLKIIVPEKGEISKYAAVHLQNYIQSVAGSPIAIIPDSSRQAETSDCIVIGSPQRNKQAAQAGFSFGQKDLRKDAYALKTIKQNGRTIVIAAGVTEHGDKYAVHHLIRNLPIHGNTVLLEIQDVLINPFIKYREVILGDACPWDPFVYVDEMPENKLCRTYDIIFNSRAARLNCPDEKRGKAALRRIVEKYCIENWNETKLKAYIEQMDAFGFNSIQFSDEAENYLHSGCLVTRRGWREKLLGMMRQTRKIGNRVTLLTWGAYGWLMNGKRVVADWNDPLCDEPIIFSPDFPIKDSKCWNDPEGRRMIQAHMDYMSEYMPFSDHVISHFFDPGGCSKNGCTMGTCMRIMNHQFETFGKKNPRLTATFNVWPLASDHDGFSTKEVCSSHSSTWTCSFNWWMFTKVVDLLHPDIMIASRKYDSEIAALCKKWGRKYGLWAWYTSDQEITASLHVEAERLGREFGTMPPQAGDILEYVSMPVNCHGLADASAYIAARLMWFPARDPFEILREFCLCVFGPKLAKAVYDGYHAIARIRNRDIAGDSAFNDSYLGAGTPDPDADATLAGSALAGLECARADRTWVSKIPLAVNRDEMIEDLRDHLKIVYQYACFRSTFLDLVRQERISPLDWKRLPAIDRLGVSGGMIEWRKAAEILEFSKQSSGR